MVEPSSPLGDDNVSDFFSVSSPPNRGRLSTQQRTVSRLVAARQSRASRASFVSRDGVDSTNYTTELGDGFRRFRIAPVNNMDDGWQEDSDSDRERPPSFKTASEDRQGLVRPELSTRHSQLGRRQSVSSQMAKTFSSDRISVRRLSQQLSKDRVKQESVPLSALPPMADILASGVNVDVERAGPDPNIVTWDGPEDPNDPMSWSKKKKWASTVILAWMTFIATLASSIFSPAITPTSMEFRTSPEIMTLGMSLTVVGYAFGPFFFGPLSELYGRKRPLFAGYLIFLVMNIPVATAKNLVTVLVVRFLVGFFGSAPLTIVIGVLCDIWTPVQRSIPGTLFPVASLLGPLFGPIIGGALTGTEGWRWTAWITLIAGGFFGILGWLIYKESFAPVLLKRKAKKDRRHTRNWALHAPVDEIDDHKKMIMVKYLVRPFQMLLFEPILLLFTFYMSLINGILYLFFVTYPFSFHLQRRLPLEFSGLPLLAINLGVLIGVIIHVIFVKRRYMRIVRGRGWAPPEERLPSMMIGGVLLVAGMFWFGWTSSPKIFFMAQVMAGVPTGIGICLVTLQGINYILDVYGPHAASAMAINQCIRSIFGAGFPMFGSSLYAKVGLPWGISILAFIAVIMIPVPIVFFKKGAMIRMKSKLAQNWESPPYPEANSTAMVTDPPVTATRNSAGPVKSRSVVENPTAGARTTMLREMEEIEEKA